MESSFDTFDPGALLARTYELPRGPRVRLRLARPGDRAAIRALLRHLGVELDELEVARLAGSEPRRRIVICATALIGLAETIVGIGSISTDLDDVPQPDTLIVDHDVTEGLDELLRSALIGRARAIAEARAA